MQDQDQSAEEAPKKAAPKAPPKAASPLKSAAGGNEVKIESNPEAGNQVRLFPQDIVNILQIAETAIRKGLFNDDLDKLSAVLATRDRVRSFVVAAQAAGSAGSNADMGGQSK